MGPLTLLVERRYYLTSVPAAKSLFPIVAGEGERGGDRENFDAAEGQSDRTPREAAMEEEKVTKRTFECSSCGHIWRVVHGSPRPSVCPECESGNIRRAEEDRSQGRDRGYIREYRRASRLRDEG